MRIAAIGRIAGAATFVVVAAAGAHAGTPCMLPEAYPIALEARGAVLGTGRGVVAVVPPGERSLLVAGDAVRQANGDGVETCADVERAAATSFAKGLPLLLAVERPSGLVAVLVPAREPGAPAPAIAEPIEAAESARTSAPPGEEPVAVADGVASVPAVPVLEEEVPAAARAVAVVPAAAPATHAGKSNGIVAARREPPPPLALAATVDPALRETASEAATLLEGLQERSSTSVPISAYELERRRVDDAARALDFGAVDGATAVRGLVLEVLEAHQTASDILAAKVEYTAEMNRNMRTRAPREMPYFSDGPVPRWVTAFPFLQEAVLAPPKERLFLQSSGRWSPDRAVALLWAHTGEETERLARWSAGD